MSVEELKSQTFRITKTIVYETEYTYNDFYEKVKDKNYSEKKLLKIWKKMVTNEYEEGDMEIEEAEEGEHDDEFENQIELNED